MQNFRPIKSIESISPGNTAVAKIPIGPTHFGFQFSQLPIADISEIRLVLNGGIVQRWKGSQLAKDIQFDRMADPSAGDFTLWMNRYGLKTRAAEEFTALGTQSTVSENNPVPVRTAVLEVDIKATAVSPTLKIDSISSPQTRPVGLIKKVKQFNYSFGGGGEKIINDLPKGDLINRIFIYKTGGTGTIDNLKVERDQYVLFDRTVAKNSLIQSNGERSPQADMWVIDPTELGYGDEGLSTRDSSGKPVNELLFYLNCTADVDLDIKVEYIGTLKD